MKKVTSNIPTDLLDIDVYDVLSVDWSSFVFDGDEISYTLKQEDIERPDMLSYKLYGSVAYQNILFVLNNIGDILNLVQETVIIVPKIESLKKFLYDNRKV
jgi:hypothetical protein